MLSCAEISLNKAFQIAQITVIVERIRDTQNTDII